jgi:hypothetical protein
MYKKGFVKAFALQVTLAIEREKGQLFVKIREAHTRLISF